MLREAKISPVLFSLVCGAQLAPSCKSLWFVLSGYQPSSGGHLQGDGEVFSSSRAPFLETGMSAGKRNEQGAYRKPWSGIPLQMHTSEWALCVRAGHLLGPLGSTTAGGEARLISIFFIQAVSLHEKVFFQLNNFFLGVSF